MTDHPARRPARLQRWTATTVTSLLLPLLWAAAGSLPATAAEPQDGRADADARYRQERAACLDGSSAQDRTTCLKEAGAARAETRRRSLDNGETAAQLRANALQRCQRVAADDRAACERMVQGEGQRSGSVAAGGVLTQITTRSAPAQPDAAASR